MGYRDGKHDIVSFGVGPSPCLPEVTREMDIKRGLQLLAACPYFLS
jgi:hypothetical protein